MSISNPLENKVDSACAVILPGLSPTLQNIQLPKNFALPFIQVSLLWIFKACCPDLHMDHVFPPCSASFSLWPVCHCFLDCQSALSPASPIARDRMCYIVTAKGIGANKENPSTVTFQARSVGSVWCSLKLGLKVLWYFAIALFFFFLEVITYKFINTRGLQKARESWH